MDKITFKIYGMLQSETVVEDVVRANVAKHVGKEVEVEFEYGPGEKAGVTTLIIEPSEPELASDRLVDALTRLPSFQIVKIAGKD